MRLGLTTEHPTGVLYGSFGTRIKMWKSRKHIEERLAELYPNVKNRGIVPSTTTKAATEPASADDDTELEPVVGSAMAAADASMANRSGDMESSDSSISIKDMNTTNASIEPSSVTPPSRKQWRRLRRAVDISERDEDADAQLQLRIAMAELRRVQIDPTDTIPDSDAEKAEPASSTESAEPASGFLNESSSSSSVSEVSYDPTGATREDDTSRSKQQRQKRPSGRQRKRYKARRRNTDVCKQSSKQNRRARAQQRQTSRNLPAASTRNDRDTANVTEAMGAINLTQPAPESPKLQQNYGPAIPYPHLLTEPRSETNDDEEGSSSRSADSQDLPDMATWFASDDQDEDCNNARPSITLTDKPLDTNQVPDTWPLLEDIPASKGWVPRREIMRKRRQASKKRRAEQQARASNESRRPQSPPNKLRGAETIGEEYRVLSENPVSATNETQSAQIVVFEENNSGAPQTSSCTSAEEILDAKKVAKIARESWTSAARKAEATERVSTEQVDGKADKIANAEKTIHAAQTRNSRKRTDARERTKSASVSTKMKTSKNAKRAEYHTGNSLEKSAREIRTTVSCKAHVLTSANTDDATEATGHEKSGTLRPAGKTNTAFKENATKRKKMFLAGIKKCSKSKRKQVKQLHEAAQAIAMTSPLKTQGKGIDGKMLAMVEGTNKSTRNETREAVPNVPMTKQRKSDK